ncbi:MAG: hypothetical protein QNK23_17905 [Crocinitomicaceae bacterium]|nr:hypothetical protein [Crocinitomicaceae bacterium]
MKWKQFYAIALALVLSLPFTYSSISNILDSDDQYELSETEEERSGEEEEGEHGIEEFIVDHRLATEINEASTFKSSFIHLQTLYRVYQELSTPPPEFV